MTAGDLLFWGCVGGLCVAVGLWLRWYLIIRQITRPEDSDD